MSRPAGSRSCLFLGLTAILLVSLASFAGDLTPPAGPVAPTMKTIQEAEPRIPINLTNTPGDADSIYKITAPGSYYLTGNVQAQVFSNKHGIEIASSGVTIDLNGFELRGGAGMGLFDGIEITVSNLLNIEVRNGSVSNWGGSGVSLASLNAGNCVIKNLRVSGNARYGVLCGANSTIHDVIVSANTLTGIETSDICTISACVASNNGGLGIKTGEGCTVSGCTASGNNTAGVQVGAGSTMTESAAYANAGPGFSATVGCVVTDSAAYANGTYGFLITSGATITTCNAHLNTLDGIRFVSQCVVKDNNCSSNGFNGDGAGIHATGNDNQIDGNRCVTNDRGVDVDAASNVIIRNVCSGNALNWDVASGNTCFIVVAPTSAAISGNSGGTAPTANPWANFTQ